MLGVERVPLALERADPGDSLVERGGIRQQRAGGGGQRLDDTACACAQLVASERAAVAASPVQTAESRGPSVPRTVAVARARDAAWPSERAAARRPATSPVGRGSATPPGIAADAWPTSWTRLTAPLR